MKAFLDPSTTSSTIPAMPGCTAIDRWQNLDRVLEVDQTPSGKTPRSCPAAHVGFWDDIRKLFANIEEARLRGQGLVAPAHPCARDINAVHSCHASGC